MKRRWPFFLFVACWLMILLVPSLRGFFLAQVRPGAFYGGWAHGPFVSDKWFADTTAESIAARFPNDVRVLFVQAERINTPQGRAFDPLIQRFPDQPWLLAKRLDITIKSMRLDRVGGELSDTNIQQNRAAGIPSPERAGKPNFTHADLKEAIDLTRRGQKLEPDNAYWDWLEAYFLMAAWRDAEAWQVIARGSHKSQFDAHGKEVFQAHIAAVELQLGRPLLIEEAIVIQAGTMFVGQYGKYREMARIIAWQGRKAEKRGDHTLALRIYSDCGRLMYLAQRESYDAIGMMVYRAISALILGGNGRSVLRSNVPAGQFGNPQVMAPVQSRLFGTYAKAHGRPDLAREMDTLIHQSAQQFATFRNSRANQELYNSMPARPIVWAVSLWGSGLLILLLLPLLLSWWLLTGVLLRSARMLPEASPEITTRDVWNAAFGAALPTALCWGVAFAAGAICSNTLALPVVTFGRVLNEPLSSVSLGLLVLGLLLPGPLATLFCHRRCVRRLRQLQTSVQNGGFRNTWLNRWRERHANWHLSSFLTGAMLWFVVVFSGLYWGLLLTDNTSATITIPTFLEYFWAIVGTGSTEFSYELPQAPVLCGALVFALSLSLVWLRGFFSAPRALAIPRLRLLHATLGALIFMASVSYVLLLITSVPVRTETYTNLQTLVQQGEIKLLANPKL